MKNKIFLFALSFFIFVSLFFCNVSAAEYVEFSYNGDFLYSGSMSSLNFPITMRIQTDSYLVYIPDGYVRNNITYYYSIGSISNGLLTLGVGQSVLWNGSAISGNSVAFYANIPIALKNYCVVNSNDISYADGRGFYTSVYNVTDNPDLKKPILIKVWDVIVNSNAFQSVSKLGKWVRDSITDVLTFEPIGSLVSVDMGDTVTVTSIDNSVTNVPTTYIQPNITYNGFNTSVNINTNKVVDYMGKDEDTFKSITYNITYEYIDDNSETNTVTYTYNYNYDDKVITYGPESDPDENNSTDDTTITVVQPDGSNNVQNSGGALSTLISTIANIFISAVSGLIGGLATVVSSLSSLVTSTGGLFNTLGGVISPLYQGTIIGDIVTLLGLSLIATFIIGFFKR